MSTIEFSNLQSSLVPEQLKTLLDEHRKNLEHKIEESNAQDLLKLLNAQGNQLEQFWSPVSHLNSVIGSADWRECYQACLPLLTANETFIYQNQALFEKLKNTQEQLSPGEFKMREDFLLACQLSGIHLNAQQRKKVQDIFERLDDLSQIFQNNIVDSMKQFRYHTLQLKDLDGLPEHIILNAKKRAEEEQQAGYVLGLDQPTYIAVISYAKDKALRKRYFQAYGTRASDQSDYDQQRFDNTDIILETLDKRQELANLVGLKDYASYSLSNKMAKDLNRVTNFLHLLKDEVKSMTAEDVKVIKEFARSQGHLQDLEPWDIAYFVQMRQQVVFDINQEALRDYFPLSHVMKGLNLLFQKLYGLKLEKMTGIDVWHPDVESYVLKHNQHGVGYIYCDWFSREGKRGGAWMDTLQTRCRLPNGNIQQAIATLTCNFAKPAPQQEALLTHEELLTLLHEFGHCMHHILSEVDEFALSGVHGVEWDAVELPSQWMENWGWVEDWIKIFSKHIKTGDSLPHHVFEQLLKLKNDLTGLYLSRQIIFALYDISIHSSAPPKDREQVHQQYLNLLKEIAVWPIDLSQRFPQNFSHIFSGGYAAGYYSYLWADVLSSDAFEWFAEDLEKISEKGRAFRQKILSKGGSVSALDAFIEFRGREPDQNALLRAYGLGKNL
jgi:oligopeptidase A